MRRDARVAADDDDVWVYYAKTALVPYLRSAELARLGCRLPLPADAAGAARPRAGASGARWCGGSWRTGRRGRTRATRQAIATCSRASAATTSPLLRTTPPLLYHNDLTATVAAYYWSEDAGYALWLRLYDVAR